MALGSTVAPAGRVLIPQNGFFGERLEEMARAYTPHVRPVKSPLGKPIDLGRVEESLRRQRFDVVAVVHCETSTGLINPIRELAELCRRHGAPLIVDAISSLGIEPLEMDAWGIGICVSASQKGLEAPPGLALVAVGKEAWVRIEAAEGPGWYLSLRVWREYTRKWGDWHPHPITQPVNNVRALRVGMERILREGLGARFRRHREVTDRLRWGLRGLGLEPLVADAVAAHGVTAARGPEGKVDALLAGLRDRHGILIAGGLGELKGKIFRIAHMGPGASEEAVDTVLSAIKAVMGDENS
jgi:aspartate aminotransferase-like enzyme